MTSLGKCLTIPKATGWMTEPLTTLISVWMVSSRLLTVAVVCVALLVDGYQNWRRLPPPRSF
jgi:hypothetical protein